MPDDVISRDDLTSAERQLIQAVAEGRPCVFPKTDDDEDRILVRAEVLRLLIRGESAPGDWPFARALDDNRARLVRLINARVIGKLDLDETSNTLGSGPGTAVVFERCLVEEPISARNAAFRRFAITDSAFSGLDLNYSSVSGHVDLRRSYCVRGGDRDTRPKLLLKSISIGGELLLSDLQVASPYAAMTGRRSIDISHARVTGGVVAPRARIEGRVIVVGAVIGGGLSFEGASIFSQEKAVEAEGVRVAGALRFNRYSGPTRADRASYFRGAILLEDAVVGAQADFSLSEFDSPGAVAILARNAAFRGGVDFTGAWVRGSIKLQQAAITGDLDFGGVALSDPDGGYTSVAAHGVHVSGMVNFDHQRRSGYFAPPFVEGDVFCPGATIHQSFVIAEYAQVDGLVNLVNARIERDVFVVGPSTLCGPLNLNGARVAGCVNLLGAARRSDADPPGREISILAVIARDCRVVEDFRWDGVSIGNADDPGRIDLRGAVIEGDLSAKDLQARREAIVDLTDARCRAIADNRVTGWGGKGVELRLAGFRYTRVPVEDADLLNVLNTRIEAALSRMRGGFVQQILGALTLARVSLALLRVYLARERRKSVAQGRLEWLRRQHRSVLSLGVKRFPNPKGSVFSYQPQPFQQLEGVLRDMGLEDQARDVAVARRRAERRAGSLLRLVYLLPFDLMFGYGLKPGRAIVTVAVALGLGFAGVHLANDRGALVLNPAVTTGVVMDAGRTPAPALQRAGPDAYAEAPCGREVSTWVYAADLFIPLVEFGHERRCRITTTERGDGWRILKALYQLAGWIIISLAILTFTGVLRRSG